MDFFNHPLNMLGVGFALGIVLWVLSVWGHWGTKREFRRYKMMLSDKLELDSRHHQELQKERDRLQSENENLKVLVTKLNERTDNKLSRDLEIYARAERQMKINAPGFAGAWEMAKDGAQQQLQDEERGKSFPQRLFRRLVGANRNPALPAKSADPDDAA